ncbi:MAG TPA: AMP-binding protein [Flavobacteriales bacterium]|nr:AMP-binding protein [Flavobacteriales bacterium]
MPTPFKRLTIDGRTLEGADIVRYADTHFATADAPWQASVRGTLHALLSVEGGMPAHTSGTTGAPKDIVIPAKDLWASARLTARTFDLKEGDRALLCLPCDFIAGKMMLVRSLVIGLDLHVVDPRGSVLDNLGTNDRFRFAAMVPLQLHRAIQEDRARVEHQFETIILGGGPVSDVLIEDLKGLRTQVFHTYGSTETVTHVALRALNGAARSDHFTALHDISFALDEHDCLTIRTPHLSEQEHLTNDIVELIDATHFRWLGRFDNVILSGGKKLFPEAMETRTAGVIPYAHFFTAVFDERLGQAALLVLETDRPAEEVLPEVLEKMVGVLDEHELPRRVAAVEQFRRTSAGKVMREATLAQLA